MDRGAHFYKSDFQVHSCRDAQWNGAKPTTPEERYAIATAFITQCRTKGLGAIAITDHHDICCIKYVQLAAQGVALADFDSATFVPDPGQQRPIVFPGMELTLQVPCQAIVLLDAASGVTVQELLLQVLGLVPMHPEADASGPQVTRLPFQTLQELEERLRGNAGLGGRFIVLPNLNEGGQDTLLRSGFHHHYATMPCVGGYTEQDYGTFSSGHVNKLNGGDENYGSKAVGMFQTSDSRREDCQQLACRTTWVKFAEPTAEALRQACLAQGSRLFQTEPTLPRRYIARVEVTGSIYLGAIDQYLNPQFNALIGGRGTGKSSFLEYVRWAMQDQPVDPAAEDAVDRKRQHFLDTLKQVGGVVRVHWLVDGTAHMVSYDPSRSLLTLKVGADQERPAMADEIRDLLPIRAYSQKQLSSVSGKRAELQRFVEEPIRDRLRQFDNEFEALRGSIRTHHANRRRRADLTAQVQLQHTRLASVQERIRTLQGTLANLPEDAERALREYSARLTERGYVENLTERVKEMLEDVDRIGRQFRETERTALPEDETPQKASLLEIEAALDRAVQELVMAVVGAKAEFEEKYKEVAALLEQWQGDHDRHEQVLTTAQSQEEENKAVLEQLRELRAEEAEATSEVARLQRALREVPDGTTALTEAKNKWLALHMQRSQVLTEQCRNLSAASAGKLDVELHPGRDVEQAMQVLESKLQGARIHGNRWEALKNWLSDGGLAVQRWNTLCQELLALVESKEVEVQSPPVLPSWDLTEGMRNGIRTLLSADGWLDLATLTIQDVPSFFYTGGGTRLRFEQASAGQQATVLLTLLLKDAEGPLIIDQPEDDLDSEVIGDVIESIMAAKQVRQLIFASHNANLVVNGDAELVVKFRTVIQEGRSSGQIEHEGAIDCRPVRDAITTVMEGGRKAFDLRRQKYGF